MTLMIRRVSVAEGALLGRAPARQDARGGAFDGVGRHEFIIPRTKTRHGQEAIPESARSWSSWPCAAFIREMADAS